MIPDAYREAHSAADAAIADIAGLAYALYGIASEASCIDQSTPEANAIMSLIRTIEERVKAAEHHQDREWEAIRAVLHKEIAA